MAEIVEHFPPFLCSCRSLSRLHLPPLSAHCNSPVTTHQSEQRPAVSLLGSTANSTSLALVELLFLFGDPV